MQPAIRRILFLIFLFSLWQISFGSGLWSKYAQAQSCTDIITNLTQAFNECSNINFNWVCYGSAHAEAQPQPYRFYQTSDRRPFPALLDVSTQDKDGVVLMNLLVEGETAPLKIILFGTAEVQTPGQIPNAFTLKVNDQGYLCDATRSGMIVQTEKPMKGFVTVNGVDIELGSTAYITIQQDGIMRIVNIEGLVTVRINGFPPQVLTPGQESQITFVGGRPAFNGNKLVTSPLAASRVGQWLAQIGLPRIHNTNATKTEAACIGEIKFGETITETTVDSGQECLFKFCAKAGDTVTTEMDAVDKNLNPWLDLRGPGGALVAFNDDIKSTDTNSLICNRGLPLTSCDYTIVARSTENITKGQFKLSLNKQTACVQPELRCNVVAPGGTGLRLEPKANATLIQNLPANTHLKPLERSTDGAWAHVQVLGNGKEGWVKQAAGSVECEDDPGLMPVQDAKVQAAAAHQPDETPTDNAQHCQNKCSPFGEP